MADCHVLNLAADQCRVAGDVPPNYDSMILKLIVHDKDRKSAIAKMRSALGELVIEGITTNLDFQYEIINHEEFERGNIDTDFIPQHFPQYCR